MSNINSFHLELVRLKPYFSEKAFVHLQHCDIGQNEQLVGRISSILGVPVYAGTGKHNPVYRFNFGVYVKCVPSGNCKVDVDRP